MVGNTFGGRFPRISARESVGVLCSGNKPGKTLIERRKDKVMEKTYRDALVGTNNKKKSEVKGDQSAFKASGGEAEGNEPEQKPDPFERYISFHEKVYGQRDLHRQKERERKDEKFQKMQENRQKKWKHGEAELKGPESNKDEKEPGSNENKQGSGQPERTYPEHLYENHIEF